MALFDSAFFIVAVILLAGAAGSVKGRKLTLPAGVGAFVVGLLVYSGGRYAGLAMLALFFLLATWATAHKKQRKAGIEGMQRHQERRKLGQVIANGGIAAVAGLLACLFPAYSDVCTLLLAGALSAATADTLASELGMVYGRHPFNILTFKPEAGGKDGVISLEGTLVGIGGSALIALTDAFAYGFGNRVWIIVLAGTAGNVADSLLGASLERKQYIGNDTVNILNTFIGGLTAFLLYRLF